MTRLRPRELAERTPERRVRHIDLLRAVAIGAVVLGHWLLVVVETGDGLAGYSALAVVGWAHPVTWLFQVMPVFFMVGGFANSASLQARRRRGDGDRQWLLDRSARLVQPTAVLLVTLAATAALARVLGAAPELVGTAVWLASLPLWFLAAYLGMVFLTPVMHALHRRLGLAVPVLLLVPVLAGDLLRLRLHDEAYAWGNFLFAWLAIHQVGFCWQDGRLPVRRRVAWPLLAGGLAALVLLTVAGPYPVSMVSVPGAQLQNSSPPTLALVALATAQLGLALLLQPASERWLRRPRPWTVVVGVNSVILTVFLWHLSAAVLGALALYATGLLPTPPPGSPAWLGWRLPWLATLAVLLTALVAAFGRFETRAAAAPAAAPVPAGAGRLLARRSPQAAATAGGYLGALVGLGWQAAAGPGGHGPLGPPTGSLVVFLLGTGLLWLARAARR